MRPAGRDAEVDGPIVETPHVHDVVYQVGFQNISQQADYDFLQLRIPHREEGKSVITWKFVPIGLAP